MNKHTSTVQFMQCPDNKYIKSPSFKYFANSTYLFMRAKVEARFGSYS